MFGIECRVSQLMLPQVGLLRARVGTKGTPKWLFASVGAGVIDQVRLPLSGVGAKRALVLFHRVSRWVTR